MFVLANGCQQEVIEIIQPPAEEVIIPGSPVADLVERVSLKDGSADNILDKASCLTLVLPVTVRIDDDLFRVETEEDLKWIEEILEADDDDDLEIIYPVTGLLPDYTEVIINGEDELDDIRKGCTGDGDDDDIECVDFRFPLTIFGYDAENQLSEVITITNDRQLYEFFDEIGEDEFYTFEFPLVLVLAGNGEIVAGNNDELEDIIEDAGDDCDEDDDIDFNDDDSDAGAFTGILTTGEWEIKSYKDVQEEKTGLFAGYLFVFHPDGRVEVDTGDETFYGTWEIGENNGNLELDLEFDDDTLLDEIEEDWEVIGYDDNTIQLADETDDQSDDEQLTFGRK
jgi:hypothetical protein